MLTIESGSIRLGKVYFPHHHVAVESHCFFAIHQEKTGFCECRVAISTEDVFIFLALSTGTNDCLYALTQLRNDG